MPSPGVSGDPGVAAVDGNTLFEQVVPVELVAVNGGPLGMGEHGAEVEGHGCGDAGADHLEEEGHVGSGGGYAGLQDVGDTAGDDEAVAVALLDGNGTGYAAVVVGDGRAHFFAQEAVAGYVLGIDGPFPDGDLGEVGFEFAHNGYGGRNIEQEVVPVAVDVEPVGRDLADAFDGLVDIVPGAGLDFDGGESQLDGDAGLFFVGAGAHVVVPEGDGAPAAHLLTQEAVDGYAGEFAGGVEEGHLQAGAERVIPHQVEG